MSIIFYLKIALCFGFWVNKKHPDQKVFFFGEVFGLEMPMMRNFYTASNLNA